MLQDTLPITIRTVGAKAQSLLQSCRYWFPLTPLGIMVTGLGYWISFHIAREEVDFVLHAAGLASLFIVGLALLCVLITSLGLWITLQRPTEPTTIQLETGASRTTGFEAPSLSWLPMIHLSIRWDNPREVEVTLVRGFYRSQELIRPLRRGATDRLRRRFIVSDIFGLVSLGFVRTTPSSIHISPQPARVSAHVTRRFLGGDALSHPDGPRGGELVEMRRYAHGDPLRHVLWKTFARTRKLLVRAPEQAITPLPSSAAYLIAEPADEPVASVARTFLEEGLLGGDFLFGADGAVEPTDNPTQALEQIIASAHTSPSQETGLEAFVAHLDVGRRRRCFFFIPPVPGPWLKHLQRVAPAIADAQVITAVDWTLAPPRPPWRGMLFAQDTTNKQRAAKLVSTLQLLDETGLEVQVLYRPSGELLGGDQLSALRDLFRTRRPWTGRRSAGSRP